jgi:hypothetical protein
MPTPLNAVARAQPPSVTSWTRIEPKPRDGTLARGLQAQIRDAAWILSRQWQLGEFAGEDAGSPVQATIGVTNRTLSTYRPGDDAASTVALDEGLPLEIHVEREPVISKLRAAVQLGLFFERALQAGGQPTSVRDGFRAQFPIPQRTDDDATYDGGDGDLFRQLVTGRVVDGVTLYLSATGAPGAPPLPAIASNPAVAAVIADFVKYRRGVYSEPNNDRAWQPEELAYDFAVGSPLPNDNLTLHAEGFPGGHLDWYSFHLGTNDPAKAGLPQATTSDTSFIFLPQHVTFRGMPEPRWWTFESGTTDFGALDPQTVDLATMLVMEFALTYGNDWFIVPLPTDIGTLSTVDTLVVTDTFGLRTLIRSAEQTQVNPGETPWSMFKLFGDGVRSAFIFVAPTLGVTDEGVQIENVNFLRDDMAAMAWAVEHKLHGTWDEPVDAFEAYLATRALDPIPTPTPKPGDPPIYYTLESVVPYNWIPLVPVQTAAGSLYFRRGVMERETSGGPVPIPAHASVLEPGTPFFLTDRIVTHIGVDASITFRRSRGTDGRTYVWYARNSGPGKGPGWSGLRFDYLQTFGAAGPANP